MYVETLKIIQNRQNAIDVELVFNKNKLYGLKAAQIIKARYKQRKVHENII